ncbi:hypothetical protein GPJ56_004864 [Histomonas meleagridis]|uniref:uncharacterized protein n=1 Tax=Histomonas meleagridis TaxID=135588 RepID=UPI00355A4CAF|nr:hypothetical protein GPJ56_004864 [Histomonas meleagridis]KAH0803514.1 hypothetical protein GO595_003858 [Histomonas meleagridis]
MESQGQIKVRFAEAPIVFQAKHLQWADLSHLVDAKIEPKSILKESKKLPLITLQSLSSVFLLCFIFAVFISIRFIERTLFKTNLGDATLIRFWLQRFTNVASHPVSPDI